MKYSNVAMKRLLTTAAISAQLLALGAGTAWAVPAANLKVKLLAINDFHGQLSSKTVSGHPAGGAAVLASYLKSAQSGMEDRSIIISAGDLIGASPADSGLLQDEPTIMFMNTLANAYCADRMSPQCNVVATVGNHEFDEGVTELNRMIFGGNYATGPFLENPYSGAHYPYLAANVIDKSTGKPILPPYVIKTIRNTPIAFIGAVLTDTPNIVAPDGVSGVSFIDEATAINSYIPEIKAKGVRAIVAIIHQGGTQTAYNGATDATKPAVTGDIVPIVNKLDAEVDVVLSAHTHNFTNAVLKNAGGNDVLVTQAYSSGTAYANIDIEISPVTKDIVKKSAAIISTFGDSGPGLTPDATVSGIVTSADTKVNPIVSKVVGQISQTITRTQNADGESPLGNLIADAQRAYEKTDFAFMNPGGIRNDLVYNAAISGNLTWGDVFSVQPFGNLMVKMTLTGQQIYDVLAQQWATSSTKMLQISGLTYSWAFDAATSKGVIIEVKKDGMLLDKNASYTVAVNNFLAGGGDSFTVFKSGANQVTGAKADVDALVDYIKGQNQPFSAAIEGRVTRIYPATSNATAARFAVFSDPHLYDISALGGVTNGTASSPDFIAYLAQDRKMIVESSEILDSTLADLKAQPLDFVLVTGDLTKDGEYVDHQLMATKLAELKASGKKIFVIPGNHDIYNPGAVSYTTSPPTPVQYVSPDNFRQIYADFGFNSALYKDPNSLSYIAEPVTGVWLFALDSCEYANNVSSNTSTTAGALTGASQSWILDHLAAAKALGKKVIGMEHHGILEHYTGQSIQFPEYVLTDWQNVAQKLSDHGLNVMFTGHFHANDVTLKDFTTSVLHDVETGSLVTFPSPYRIVDFDITNKKLAISTSHVTSTASHPGDFPAFAKNYLQTGMTGLVSYQLSHAPYNLAEPSLSYITSLVVPAFMAHYAGDETPDATAIGGYTYLLGTGDATSQALGQSLYALWNDPAPGDNNLTITIGIK